MSRIDWEKVEPEVKQHSYTLPLYILLVAYN